MISHYYRTTLTEHETKIATGVLIGVGIACLIFLIISIWGIVSAAKTTDTDLRVGRLLLHLFLFGSFIAAIIYAVKTSSNRQAKFQKDMLELNSRKKE